MADRAAKFVFFFLHRMVCANKHRMDVIYIMNESFKRLQLCPLFSAGCCSRPHCSILQDARSMAGQKRLQFAKGSPYSTVKVSVPASRH